MRWQRACIREQGQPPMYAWVEGQPRVGNFQDMHTGEYNTIPSYRSNLCIYRHANFAPGTRHNFKQTVTELLPIFATDDEVAFEPYPGKDATVRDPYNREG